MANIRTQREINEISAGIKTVYYFMLNGFARDPQDGGAFFQEDKPYGSLAALMGCMVQTQDEAREALFMLQHNDADIPAKARGELTPMTRDAYVRRIRSRLYEARKWHRHNRIYRIRLQEWAAADLRILLNANRRG